MISFIFTFLVSFNTYADFGEIAILVSESAQRDLLDQGVEPNLQSFKITSNPIASLQTPSIYYISSEIGGYQNIVSGLLVKYRCTSKVYISNGEYQVLSTECDVFAGKSYLNYPELSLLINTINSSTDGEEKLTISEHSQRGRNWVCAATTYKSSEQVFRDFVQVIEETYANDGSEYEALKQRAFSQFRELIGQGNYNFCTVQTNTPSTVYLFIGETYQFSLEVK